MPQQQSGPESLEELCRKASRRAEEIFGSRGLSMARSMGQAVVIYVDEHLLAYNVVHDAFTLLEIVPNPVASESSTLVALPLSNREFFIRTRHQLEVALNERRRRFNTR